MLSKHLWQDGMHEPSPVITGLLGPGRAHAVLANTHGALPFSLLVHTLAYVSPTLLPPTTRP